MSRPLLLLALCACVAAALLVWPAEAQRGWRVETRSGVLSVEKLAGGLDHPWGMAFLPEGRLLVTERSGALRILERDGTLSAPLPGAPEVRAAGQGGLLDVALDPDFASNGMVYLSFAEVGAGGSATALGRGRLRHDRLEGFEVLFRQEPRVGAVKHYGGRIVFAPDGRLFLTLGERGQLDPAQDLSNHLGAIVRLERDGSIPEDNPFVGRDDAEPETWSYGHRNVEAAALHPSSRDLWVAEMGPSGGDELNRIEPGANYGWPEVSWGKHYDGREIPDPPTSPHFHPTVHQWTPVISPSGMLFYDGARFPAWRGDLFIGGLSARALVRVELDGDVYQDEERIVLDARIRDVEEGPDGTLVVLTDSPDGAVLRLEPAR